jgi:hypothetical protein
VTLQNVKAEKVVVTRNNSDVVRKATVLGHIAESELGRDSFQELTGTHGEAPAEWKQPCRRREN